MKKIALIVMVLVSCCIFCSCGKPSPVSDEFIMLSVATDDSGMINQSLQYSVGSKKLKAAGLSDSQIEDFRSRLLGNIKVFHDEFYLGLLLTFTSDPQPAYQIGKAVFITSPVYASETDTIGFDMLFASQSAWNFYHKSSGTQETKPQSSQGFMITTIESGMFPFSTQINGSYVGERYDAAYKDALEEIQINYDPDLVYDYATPSRQLKSDSNYSFENNLYHHVWMKKISDLSESKITLYTTYPNLPIWYLTLLGATLCGVGLSVIIIKLKSKKNI